MSDLYYTINAEKLAQVAEIFSRETDPAATDDLVEEMICADWHEGDMHQRWIDNASAQEIADWLASFYQ